MTRYFNTEGLCRPEEHYMVRLDDRMAQIKRKLVDRKKYFVINKGRQYGKTTTLRALAAYLADVAESGCWKLYLESRQEKQAAGICLSGPVLISILLYWGGVY